MRGTVSLILISLVTIQPVPVVAQEPAPNPRLQAIIRNIPREVERFSKLQPLPIVTAQEGGQSAREAADPHHAEQIRARLMETPSGTELHVTLWDGASASRAARSNRRHLISDCCTTASEEVRAIPGQESAMVDKQYSFDEVRALFIGADPREMLEVGKRIEVRLLPGDKVNDRLKKFWILGSRSDGTSFQSGSLLMMPAKTSGTSSPANALFPVNIS